MSLLLLPNSLDMKPPDLGFSSAGVVAGVTTGVVAGVVLALGGFDGVDAGFAGARFKPGMGRAGGAANRFGNQT